MFKLFGANDWQDAAMKLGERLSPRGPEGYYKFTANQWLQWAERILGKEEVDVQNMTIDSDAMSRADDIASQFSEELYGRAFEVASQRGSNCVAIKDVEEAAADCPTISAAEWKAIGVARAALVLSDQGACEQEIAILNRLLNKHMEANNG